MAAGARRLQARQGAFPDQLPLEFRQGRKNPKDQLAAGRRGVDAGALAGQDLQPDAALRELLGGIDQMLEVASQAIKLPDDERIAVPQRLQTGGEGRAVLVFAGGLIFIEVLGPDTGSEERVALQVEDLAAISFRDAGVSNQHRMYLKRSFVIRTGGGVSRSRTLSLIPYHNLCRVNLHTFLTMIQ